MANNVYLEDLRFEDIAHKIRNKNFAGRPTKFNKAGGDDCRAFSLKFDEEEAKALLDLGWNVKLVTEPDGTVVGYLSVKAKFAKKPPQIYIIREGKEPLLVGEEQVGDLDSAEFEKVSMVVHPSRFETPDGRVGFTAFLKSMYIILNSDPFAAQYGVDPLAGTSFAANNTPFPDEEAPF